MMAGTMFDGLRIKLMSRTPKTLVSVLILTTT